MGYVLAMSYYFNTELHIHSKETQLGNPQEWIELPAFYDKLYIPWLLPTKTVYNCSVTCLPNCTHHVYRRVPWRKLVVGNYSCKSEHTWRGSVANGILHGFKAMPPYSVTVSETLTVPDYKWWMHYRNLALLMTTVICLVSIMMVGKL